MTQPRHRTIRSFVLRQGRLTPAQQNALDNYWQDYGIDYSEQAMDLDAAFGRHAPVTLEIGFGNGDSLFEQARSQPGRNFLGIEVHRPGAGHLIKRIQQENICNLRVMCHDAVDILKHQIPSDSLDRVQLFFPDPWHKKRHHKRRIVQPAFVELVRDRLVKGGYFHLATDWQEYAEHMMSIMESCPGFENVSGKDQYINGKNLRPGTKFEQRGRRLGHAVWDLLYRKTA